MNREDLNISLVEDKAFDFFGVDRESIYARQGVRKVYTARHFLWLLLHDECGMSHREICKRYGRSKRMIEKSVSNTRFVVSNQRQDKERYERLKEKVL